MLPQRGTCRCGTSTGGRPLAILDQHPPHPINEVEQERQIHHLLTTILAQEHPARPSPQRHRGQRQMPATHREIDLARSGEDQAYYLKDRQAHVANDFEMSP
jgi:hypothetical protein